MVNWENGQPAGMIHDSPFTIHDSRFTNNGLSMRRFSVLLAFALLLGSASASQAASLLDVYRAAQSADAQYAAARAAWAATQERLPQGRAGLLPQAGLSAYTQRDERDSRSRDPLIANLGTQRFSSHGVTMSVTQPLYRPQSLALYEQAKTQVAQADRVLAQATQDLLLRVAQAYFDVLLAQDTVAFAQAQLRAIGQQLEQARRNFEVGTATITDTHEAQSAYDITVSNEIAAQSELEIRRRALEVLIDRAAPVLATLGPQFEPVPPQPDNMAHWESRAARSNLQVQVAETGLTFASQEVDRSRAGHRPTVDAFASYSETSRGAVTPGTLGQDGTNRVVGVQLAIPLYQGGGIESRVREALANEDRARQELESTRRTAQLATRQAYLGVTNGLARVRALEAALVSSQSSLDSTLLGQEVGVRTQVDVLNAQQQLFQTRRDLAQVRYTYILSLLNLKAAIGELTEEDVVGVNAWLTR
jgi:outer membrane protein